MQYELTTPCTAADLAPLKAGDTVLLSGVVYTARDQAHKRMLEALDKGEKLPFDLEGSAIYYVGPTPERPGEVIGSAGPTTSGRMDAMSPRLLDLGNKIMIGKGKRDAAVKEAVVRSGAVYLAALGGAGALMAQSVKTLEVIAWPDLGCEAVRRLTVEKMPLTVILDAHGGDLYTSGPAAYLETVVLLSKGEIDSKKVRVEFSLEDMDMSGFQKGATYEQIKAYVLKHTGLKVSSLYISQVKRKCGLDVGQNYNLSKKEDAKVPQCPPEKEAAIMEALKHFQMLE